MISIIQLLELFIVLCLTDTFRHGFVTVRSAFAHAQAKSGPVRPDTVATWLSGPSFSVLQVIVCALVPTVYIFSVVGAGLRQPSWMEAFALPGVVLGLRLEGFWKNALRALACIVFMMSKGISSSAFAHLGDQYHPIGRREKQRVVQTGPYAWVRHPLYALAVLQAANQSLLFWSYAPLFVLVAAAVVFAIKISVEEEIIQRDDGIREEYRAYMRKVPARLIPYVW